MGFSSCLMLRRSSVSVPSYVIMCKGLANPKYIPLAFFVKGVEMVLITVSVSLERPCCGLLSFED